MAASGFDRILAAACGVVLVAVALLFALPAAAAGRCIVVDSVTGEPLPKASVADHRGKPVGVCSDRGELPYMSPDEYPLTVSYVGYYPKTVTRAHKGKIRLREYTYDLPEVVVEPRKRQVLHLMAYVREYSTLVTANTDTVFLFREKTVDYMIPLKKNSRFKGWSNPRILDTRSYYRFTDGAGLDSVSNHYRHYFSWADWVGIIRQCPLPLRLRDDDNVTDTVRGKFGPVAIWRRADDNVYLDADILADTLNRRFVPAIGVFLRSRVDFSRFNLRYLFSDVTENTLTADNITQMSFNIEANGWDRSQHRLSTRATPLYMDTYAEVYITGREYLTVSEAKKWEKNPPRGAQIGINPPPEAPELQPAILELVERVDNIDHLALRLSGTPDERLVGKLNMKQKKRRGKLKRFLKSLFPY